MSRIIWLLCVMMFGAAPVQSQNILSLIPVNSYKVTVVKGDRVDDVYNLKDLVKKERFSQFEERFEEDSERYWYGFNIFPRYTGDQIGINERSTYYSFSEKNDSLSVSASIFEIKDKARLDAFIEDALGEEEWKKKETTGSYEMLLKEPYALVWNPRFFIIYYGYVSYSYIGKNIDEEEEYYLEELTEKEENEREVQREKIKNDLIKKDIDRVMNLNFEDAILSDRNFMKVLSGEYDAFSYQKNGLENLIKQRNQFDSRDLELAYKYGTLPSKKTEEPTINPMLQGNYNYSYWNFEETGAESKTCMVMNEDLHKHFKKFVKGSFNKRYAKYIEGDDIMAYYSLALDPKAGLEMFQALSIDLGNYVPDYDRTVSKALKIMGSLIDKKKALKTISGDMLFVITDMKEVDVRYESYAYDQDDYQRQRIIKTKKEDRPEFIFFASSDNEEMVQNILNLLEEDFRLHKQGDYYRIQQKNTGYGRDIKEGAVDLFLAFKDGVLMITNNESLVSEHLDGLPVEKRISKNEYKKITKWPFNMYWNLYKTHNSSEDDNLIKLPSFARGMVSSFSGLFDEFSLYGVEHSDNTSQFNGKYHLLREDEDGEAKFNLIDMLTGLTASPQLFEQSRY